VLTLSFNLDRKWGQNWLFVCWNGQWATLSFVVFREIRPKITRRAMRCDSGLSVAL